MKYGWERDNFFINPFFFLGQIWQDLTRQSAKTELALACFLVSIDRSCTLLEQVRNNKEKTPLDLLEADPQNDLLADLLRSYQYQSHSTQLEYVDKILSLILRNKSKLVERINVFKYN